MNDSSPNFDEDTKMVYLPSLKCSSVNLPPNQSFVFPESLSKDIEIFTDKTINRKERAIHQMKVETFLVNKGKCSHLNPRIMNDFRLRLFNMDPDKIDEEVSNNLDAKIHDYISCYVDAITYDNKSGKYPFSVSDRVYNWFVNEELVGAKSAEGFAFRTSTTPESKLFVTKSPRNFRRDELVHEALIGLYAMNKLRHYLPNYMYVYGYIQCSNAIINYKEVISWCSESEPKYSYLITENIRDAVPIKEFIVDPSIDENDFMAVFYQIENALNLAYGQYGYTHYDLHSSNIMVRKYKKLIAIPYYGTKGIIMGYITTIYVPYIIDYGYSRITVGNIGFGKIGLEHAGINGQYAFPMYDTYKLIGFLGEAIYTTTKGPNFVKFAAMLEILFSFFGDISGNLNNRVIKRLSSGGTDFYNISETYLPITHDHYINWLYKSGLPIPIITNVNDLYNANIYPEYSNPINTNLNTCDFYDRISSDNEPSTSLEYCEAVTAIDLDRSLTTETKQSALNWLDEHFNAKEYFEYSLPILINKLQSAFQYYNNTKDQQNNIIPNITTISDITLSESFYVDYYRTFIINYFRIKQAIIEVIVAIKANICALETQDSLSNYEEAIIELQTDIDDFEIILNLQNLILKNNINYTVSKDWSKSNRKVVEFWLEDHPNYLP